MNLIFLGPPGSGKGTQAAKVSEKLGLTHLSTGDLLRVAVKNQTEIGKQAEEFMNNGELVPDAIIVGCMQIRINSGQLANGFILDGFPRTISQADSLKEMLLVAEVSLNKVICFTIEDDVIVARVAGRRFCPVCQATFNVNINGGTLPKEENKCDYDGAELIIRDDDREEVVRNRLSVYHAQTKPIIEYYRNESILVEINADVAPEEVFKSILEEIM